MTAANIATKLDDIGLPAWIAVMVLGFIIWWPLGLATLAFILWSGRMGCGRRHGFGRWNEGMERMREGARRWHTGPSSGNAAFDEYKAETLRRLEEEQREFRAFLDRLRMSKDRAEFDQFMADRRRGEGPAPQPQA
jgi:hypothetical protein